MKTKKNLLMLPVAPRPPHRAVHRQGVKITVQFPSRTFITMIVGLAGLLAALSRILPH